MIFDSRIEKHRKKSVNDAFEVILEKGNKTQRFIAREILESEMLLQVLPVSEVRASGITGIINPQKTNQRIKTERLNLREAFGELYIAIAEETINDGGQRGCEGTLIHESRHAYDFARTIESFSLADENDFKVFNPTLYELEWEAHKTSGDYMIRIGLDEYLEEGLDLMILSKTDGVCKVCDDGIKQRLRESYKLEEAKYQGATAAEILQIQPRKKPFSFKNFLGL